MPDVDSGGHIELFGAATGDPVMVVGYDPGWPAAFERLRAALVDRLGSTARRIDHVGSTAVPGLAAKPIIDVQVSVPDVDDEPAFRPAIEALGWPLRAREPGHRYFRPPPGQPRAAHIHVCPAGSHWERVHLLFRDYLRAHPPRATAYGALKLELAERLRDRRLEYTDAKGRFVERTLALAEAWAQATGWRA